MSERGHAWAEYAASFALGALDDEDRIAFEAHMESCAACRAEVLAYRDVAVGVARTTVLHEPPAGLRDRILAAARATPPPALANGASAAPGEAVRNTSVKTAPRTAATARVASLPEPQGMRPTTPRRWLLAASTGVALLAGGALLSERRERRVLEQTVAGLTQQATTDRARLVGLEAALAGRDSVLATVLAADVVTLRMVAQGERPPGARVYWNRRLGRIAIAANDLPPAPAGRTYQLWGIAAGSPVSLGLFNTAADGSATSSFAIGTALDFQVAAVTEEPAGGSPQPTRTPFLVGTRATR